ncbi:MAG: FtsX-like permease family protein [Oscillospiraceae bacterium]|nr:FtsX-like permease family protein [Oscillospiraceae bacterium]
MNESIIKLTKREISSSLGRYLAIFAIIALGAGLFVGLRLSRPDFLETYNNYTHETNFYDFRLVSTLGLTDDDLAEVKKLDGVKLAEGAVGADFLFNTADEDNLIMMAQSIPENVNQIKLKAGRMPEKANECLADPNMYSEKDIGSTIKLSKDNSEQTFDTFAYDEYTIVGLTDSVLYINMERGSSTLGNGSVKGYIYIPADGFSTDYYTDIYVCVESEGYVYSDEYEQSTKKYVDGLEKFMSERAVIRRDAIIDDAMSQLDDAKKQYEDGKTQYDAAKAEYDAGYAEYVQKKSDTEAQLEQARKEIENAESMMGNSSVIDQKQAELDAAKAELDKGQAEYERGLQQFNAKAKLAYGAVDEQIAYYENRISDKQNDIAAQNAEIESLNAQLAEAQANGDSLKARLIEWKIKTANDRISRDNADIERYNERLEVHRQKRAEVDAELEPYRKQLEDAKAQLDAGYAQIESGQAELDAAREMISSGGAQLEAAKKQYEQGKAEAERGFAEAEKELASGKAQLDTAKAELDKGAAELDSAEKQIKNINHADTYVLDRDTNAGYVCFESDTNVVQSVASVFPVFFFLVAALVCLTTMTRMIADQRTQIGIMKALGYSSGAIIGKYMFYSGSATVLGSIFGIAAGSFAFPAIVWFGYGLIYNLSGLTFTMNWPLALGITAANLLVTLLVTWYCCAKELKCAPADLIRPKAPEAGKRILLERIPTVWNDMSFMQKVSARNIMRYKKRIFMMLLGIGGCTALVLTALGLNDTIQNVVTRQYDDIILYDYEITMAYDMNEEEQEIFFRDAGDDIKDAVFLYRGLAEVSGSDAIKSATLTVTDGKKLCKYIDLSYDGEPIDYPGRGEAAINYNLARQLGGIEVGDEIKLTTSEKKELTVTVSALFDNYVDSFVFISPETCEEQLGEVPEYKSALANAPDGADVNRCAEALTHDVDGVRGVMLSVDTKARMSSMMDGLLVVVAAIILCAGLLAFIVLYNLTNINISERIREIATLKVLGFYPNEAAHYVFRENLILTGAGAVFGLGLGVALHAFVMNAIKVDMMYFKPHISFLSFAVSIVITFVFAMIVNAIMRRRIDNIDMAGALKSIE